MINALLPERYAPQAEDDATTTKTSTSQSTAPARVRCQPRDPRSGGHHAEASSQSHHGVRDSVFRVCTDALEFVLARSWAHKVHTRRGRGEAVASLGLGQFGESGTLAAAQLVTAALKSITLVQRSTAVSSAAASILRLLLWGEQNSVLFLPEF